MIMGTCSRGRGSGRGGCSKARKEGIHVAADGDVVDVRGEGHDEPVSDEAEVKQELVRGGERWKERR